ncbi:MAG: hypothetical protein ACXWJZ_07620, partial [Burkholderiaceae bacterium]
SAFCFTILHAICRQICNQKAQNQKELIEVTINFNRQKTKGMFIVDFFAKILTTDALQPISYFY